MKLKKSFVITIVVILVLAASLIVLTMLPDNPQNTTDNQKTENVETVQIMNVTNPVKEFSVTKAEGGYKVKYTDGLWMVENTVNVYLNQQYVEDAFSVACTLSASALENNTSDMAKFGLGNPESIYEFTDENGNVHKIKFGFQTPTKSGYYSSINDENNVYVVSNEDYEKLCGGISFLRNKNILSLTADQVCGITIKNDKNTIKIQPRTALDANAHSSSSWEMTSPYKKEVNQYIFEEKIINVLDFTVYDFVDDNPSDYAKYGLDNPKYEIKIETYQSNYEILLGNEFFAQDGSEERLIYMQVKGLPNVFALTASSVEFKDYTPVYLMDSLVFSRIISYVKSIDFKADKMYVMKNTGTEFFINDKQVNQDDFSNAYKTIISSKILGEVVDSVGNEICSFTFNYNNGTPSETVVFYEYGDLYAAVKVNGEMYFYIERSHVDKMINNVKTLAE